MTELGVRGRDEVSVCTGGGGASSVALFMNVSVPGPRFSFRGKNKLLSPIFESLRVQLGAFPDIAAAWHPLRITTRGVRAPPPLFERYKRCIKEFHPLLLATT